MPEAMSAPAAAPWQTTTVPATPSRAAARRATAGGRAPASAYAALDALEQDVAGEAVGDHHVGRAAERHVVALDQADVPATGGQRLCRERGRGGPAQPVALARLGADGQQPDPRARRRRWHAAA